MTRQGWAERKVNTACNKFINTYPIKPWTYYAAQTLLAEHRRAVRVVRCELEKHQRRRECETNAAQRDMLGGAMLACSNILATLQRGME